jgi:hypothetical protein
MDHGAEGPVSTDDRILLINGETRHLKIVDDPALGKCHLVSHDPEHPRASLFLTEEGDVVRLVVRDNPRREEWELVDP